MGRLIDTEILIRDVEESQYNNPHTDPKISSNHRMEHLHFMALISRQPTAYDVYKVVRKIKDKIALYDSQYKEFLDRGQFKSADIVASKMIALADAIVIIREGGVNGK